MKLLEEHEAIKILLAAQVVEVSPDIISVQLPTIKRSALHVVTRCLRAVAAWSIASWPGCRLVLAPDNNRTYS